MRYIKSQKRKTFTKYLYLKLQSNFRVFLLVWMSRGSSVGIETGYVLDDRGSGVRFPAVAKNFSLLHRVQPPIQWVLGAPSPGLKRPEREADHSLPSNADVKNAWRYTSTPISLHDVVLN
jgi:hypothetical protein